jgi:hypothetical protein
MLLAAFLDDSSGPIIHFNLLTGLITTYTGLSVFSSADFFTF